MFPAHAPRCSASGPCSTRRTAETPTRPFTSACTSVADNRNPKGRPPTIACSPSNITSCTKVAATNITSRGTVVERLNCAPRTPTTKPISVFVMPPMPTMPPASASCARPPIVPAISPVTKLTRASTGDHGDEDQVDGKYTDREEPGKSGLERKSQHRRHKGSDGLQWPTSFAGSPAGGGVSTTSTSSRLEKSTPGLIVIVQ